MLSLWKFSRCIRLLPKRPYAIAGVLPTALDARLQLPAFTSQFETAPNYPGRQRSFPLELLSPLAYSSAIALVTQLCLDVVVNPSTQYALTSFTAQTSWWWHICRMSK